VDDLLKRILEAISEYSRRHGVRPARVVVRGPLIPQLVWQVAMYLLGTGTPVPEGFEEGFISGVPLAERWAMDEDFRLEPTN